MMIHARSKVFVLVGVCCTKPHQELVTYSETKLFFVILWVAGKFVSVLSWAYSQTAVGWWVTWGLVSMD